ncbi:MAG: Fic family protein, partial [Clostridiales bacterium]|nr:Fic family protein [Clostridiales bacterium]
AFIRENRKVSIAEIRGFFGDAQKKITLLRDLDKLISEGKVLRQGQSRATVYAPAIDREEYFLIDPDKRIRKHDSFNFQIFQEIGDLFSAGELADLDAANAQYRRNRNAASPAILRKELERLTIEFSWKSSLIEGNTYTLLDTERLILHAREAEGKKHEEAMMIVNHKKALDFIFAQPGYFERLSVAKIEEIHHLLVDGLGVAFGLRTTRVGIVGTAYRPLDNAFQIREATERLVSRINELNHPVEKALLAVLMISYIQPFEDGNKRTARLIGDALLLANQYCPLSYRSVDEIEYKKAVILFYEQNDFRYFKQLFVEQFKQAVKKYF